jgi:ZIP family zinc transporter
MPPILQVLLATGFTRGMTALGASLVFVNKRVNRRLLDATVGFAGGVMIAASYFSLLAPAIEYAGEGGGGSPWVPAAAGFLAGAAFLAAMDKLLPHLHPGNPNGEAEGPRTTWQRGVLLVSAITLHNAPKATPMARPSGRWRRGCRGPRSRRPSRSPSG